MIPIPLNTKTIVAGVAVLVIVLMAWRLRANIVRVAELESKLAQQANATLECADANESNQGTIDALAARIETMISERVVEQEQRERALAERDAELARARARADELERERRDEINDNVDCNALATLVVGDFCPSTAQQLRQRSGGQGSHGDENRR